MTALSLDGLTMPAAGDVVLRAVMNRHWKHLCAEYLDLRVPQRVELGVPELLRGMLRVDPRPVVRALRHPTVAGLLGKARRLGDAERVFQRSLALELDLLILTELAMANALPARVVAHVPEPLTLRSLAWGRTAAIPAGATLGFSAGAIALDERPLEGEIAYHALARNVWFATSDNNPLLPTQGHPDREGNRVDLGGASLDEWLAAFRGAFELLQRHAADTLDEMRLALELIVPVGVDPEKHFSVSYRHSVGAVYVTLHPSRMTLAEAIVHEFQHNKLHAALSSDPLLLGGDDPVYASPVRPDPRPLIGVLMAVHAFLPIARIYERIAASDDPLAKGRDFEKRFQQIVRTNHEAAVTVREHARPTAEGRTLLAEIRRWDEHYVALAQARWGGV